MQEECCVVGRIRAAWLMLRLAYDVHGVETKVGVPANTHDVIESSFCMNHMYARDEVVYMSITYKPRKRRSKLQIVEA